MMVPCLAPCGVADSLQEFSDAIDDRDRRELRVGQVEPVVVVRDRWAARPGFARHHVQSCDPTAPRACRTRSSPGDQTTILSPLNPASAYAIHCVLAATIRSILRSRKGSITRKQSSRTRIPPGVCIIGYRSAACGDNDNVTPF